MPTIEEVYKKLQEIQFPDNTVTISIETSTIFSSDVKDQSQWCTIVVNVRGYNSHQACSRFPLSEIATREYLEYDARNLSQSLGAANGKGRLPLPLYNLIRDALKRFFKDLP